MTRVDPGPSGDVLVVDDEPGLREVLQIALRRSGLSADLASGCTRALEAIENRASPYPLVITDLVMPDGSGTQVLEAAQARSSETQVIMMTAYSTVESALDAMRRGAYDFVQKPFSPQELGELAKKALEKSSLMVENRRLRAQLNSLAPPPKDDDVLGDSPAMRKVTALVEKAAMTRTTVLITGESGTGKERTAKLLHDMSERASGPFCVVNCGALPEALMESELFGHEKGAFTGAASASLGLFRQAHKGTLFLDEVGELPLSLQVKLLRALQEKKVRPVGGTQELPVDVRVLSATNRDVEAEVEAGTFRQDLYYRLNVIRIELPPLRDRRADVARLAQQMVRKFSAEFDKPVQGLSREAMKALEGYSFPGNIRELENVLERAIALTTSHVIELDDLPEEVAGPRYSDPDVLVELPEAGCDLEAVLADAERNLIRQALARTGGVRKQAAKLLGVSFRSLRYRLAKLELEVEGIVDEDSSDGVDISLTDPK
ncbi:MAG: sigma-54 dependent transcriptional regulator [Myxococcota bacterium]